ncbi:CRISPR-associated protein, partial [Salmonella enterica subsp. enterica serovar Gaminara str. A4-567]
LSSDDCRWRYDEEARLNNFNRHYHLAVHALASQDRWLRDYHTVSAPRENKKYRYYTRRDELTLAPDEVGTLISQREYRCPANRASLLARISLRRLLACGNKRHA